MGIFLGSTELGGGGGGGTPVGGYSFLQTPTPPTTFVAGQEVYTAGDGTVWLQSGATLTSAGTGALDADIYVGKRESFAAGSFTFTAVSGYQDRTGFGYNGKHMIDFGNSAASGSNARSYDNDGALVDIINNGFSGGQQPNWGILGSGTDSTTQRYTTCVSFGNDTHAFTSFGSSASTIFGTSSLTGYAYQSYSSLSGLTSYSNSFYYLTPALYMTVSHIQTTPRYWGLSGTTLQEYTFNSSAASGTNPFTAVSGSTITVVSGRLMSDGVDNIYMSSGTNIYEYSISTGLQTNIFGGVPADGGNGFAGLWGWVCIPPFRTSSGDTEFYQKTATGWNGSSPSGTPTYTRYSITNLLEGPKYIASSGGAEVTMAGVGDVEITDNNLTTFLWKRIA